MNQRMSFLRQLARDDPLFIRIFQKIHEDIAGIAAATERTQSPKTPG
jgi:hypothetical protein